MGSGTLKLLIRLPIIISVAVMSLMGTMAFENDAYISPTLSFILLKKWYT